MDSRQRERQKAAESRPVRRTEAPGRAQRQLLMDGTAVKSAFALLSVTFGESNKAYAPYPALITRTGRKDIN